MRHTHFISIISIFFAFVAVADAAESHGNAAAGKATFMKNCTVCHGNEGRGDGVAAAGLNPKPANFYDLQRQLVMTEAKQLHIVAEGGAAEKLSPLMPAFGEVLSEQQIHDVVAYVRDTFHAKEISQK